MNIPIFSESDSRGRRGSGTASRSSSPVGSGDESEADQIQSTPKGTVPRSRKKSGKTPTGGDTDSAPPSPTISVSGTTEISEESATEEWKKSAFTIIHELKNHENAERVFAAVAGNENNIAILKDMAFTTISKNMENSSIKSPVELHHALHHAFLNIVMSLDNSSEVNLNFYYQI